MVVRCQLFFFFGLQPFKDMTKIPRLPGDGAHMEEDSVAKAVNKFKLTANLRKLNIGSNELGLRSGSGRVQRNMPLRVQSVRIAEQKMHLDGPKRRTESCSIFASNILGKFF